MERANKLRKSWCFEQGYTEKKTLWAGETWYIGEGWTLKVNSINATASPRQAWLTLSKNAQCWTIRVVNVSDAYNYSIQNWAGESDVLYS